MKQLLSKLKESAMSVFPIMAIVIATSFTPIFNLSPKETIVFIISSLFLIVGMTLFSFGADTSMNLMGDLVGSATIETKNLLVIVVVGFLMGIFVTIAEPDLVVLASQVKAAIDESLFTLGVAVGVGLFLVIALLKTVFSRHLSTILLLFYMILFAVTSLISLDKEMFIPMAFDSGGVTTGPITVPFIMAFGVGIANTLGGRKRDQNSFGFVAICSIGSILLVMLMVIGMKGDIDYKLPDYSIENILEEGIFNIAMEHARSVVLAISMVFIFFLIINFFLIKLPLNRIIQIFVGLIITTVGLVLFLAAANIGLMPVGFSIGEQLVDNSKIVSVVICFIIGMTVVIAEPAIHVLNHQVEEITGGSVSSKSMLVALALGVGAAIALSMIRIIFDFSVLVYLIPGYIIALALSLFVPPLYTAIAFDSGGVASGPLSSTFILPLMLGACNQIYGESRILSLAFGVVGMIAMTPLITIQLLGFNAVIRKAIRDNISMHRIARSDDNQIIYF